MATYVTQAVWGPYASATDRPFEILTISPWKSTPCLGTTGSVITEFAGVCSDAGGSAGQKPPLPTGPESLPVYTYFNGSACLLQLGFNDSVAYDEAAAAKVHYIILRHYHCATAHSLSTKGAQEL